MKVEIHHIYKHFDYVEFIYPIMLEVLRTWTDESGYEVQTCVGKESGLDLETDADVIAFSVYTRTAPAVYRVAKELRRRGKLVIFGGPHFNGPTHREALELCDVLAITVNETLWKETLKRIESGEIRPGRDEAVILEDRHHDFRYPADLTGSFSSQRWFQMPSVPTSLGCPYACDFCSPYQARRYEPRDVETIYYEVKAVKGRRLFFADATFGLNKRHTLELMERIAPLKKRILIETTLHRLEDPEVVEALGR